MNKTAFGMRVRDARRHAKLSSDKLAELCNCTPVSIRQIESGIRLPSLPKLIDICNALHVTPNDLLGPELSFAIENNPKSEFAKRDERLDNILRKIRQLSIEQCDFVCTMTETLLMQMKKL